MKVSLALRLSKSIAISDLLPQQPTIPTFPLILPLALNCAKTTRSNKALQDIEFHILFSVLYLSAQAHRPQIFQPPRRTVGETIAKYTIPNISHRLLLLSATEPTATLLQWCMKSITRLSSTVYFATCSTNPPPCPSSSPLYYCHL